MRILTCKTGPWVRGMGLTGRWAERTAELSFVLLEVLFFFEVLASRHFHIKASVELLYMHFALFICNDNSTCYTYLQRDVPWEIPTEHHKAVCLSAPTKTSPNPTS